MLDMTRRLEFGRAGYVEPIGYSDGNISTCSTTDSWEIWLYPQELLDSSHPVRSWKDQNNCVKSNKRNLSGPPLSPKQACGHRKRFARTRNDLGCRLIGTIWRLRECARLAGMFLVISLCAGRTAASLWCGCRVFWPGHRTDDSPVGGGRLCRTARDGYRGMPRDLSVCNGLILLYHSSVSRKFKDM